MEIWLWSRQCSGDSGGHGAFLGGPPQGVKIWVNSPLLQLNCMQAGDMWLLVSGGVACTVYLLWAHPVRASRYVVDVTGEFLQAAVELHARECSIFHRVPPPQLCSKGRGTTASGTMGRSMQHPLLADSTYQYYKVVGVVWWMLVLQLRKYCGLAQ